MYLRRSSHGGAVTVVLLVAMLIMAWVEIRSYLDGRPDYSFEIDSHVGRLMQVNMDATIATSCSRASRL